jgi:hypothetical protein
MWCLVIYFILFYLNFLWQDFCFVKMLSQKWHFNLHQIIIIIIIIIIIFCKVMPCQQGITPDESRVEMKCFASRLLIITSLINRWLVITSLP